MERLSRYSWLLPSALGAIFLTALSACYPGNLTVSEADVVSTNYDPDYFAANDPRTYFMPDSVGLIGDGNSEHPLDRDDMDFILDLVERNMADYGYTRIDATTLSTETPDLVMLVSVLRQGVQSGTCVPWWPGWGWGPWPPGWGWGPGYCYPTYVYLYDLGTLTLDLQPPREVVRRGNDTELRRVWHAGLNGIVRSTLEGNRNFLQGGIDEAFEISPYLRR